MRSDVEQNEKGNSLREIRAGVWLVVLTSLILCVVTICLSRREAEVDRDKKLSAAGHAPGGHSVAPPNASALRAGHEHTRAGLTHPMQLQFVLTAEEAKTLARRAANEKARELYGFEPFANGPSARLVDGRWTWSDRQARGSADIEATVDFEADGSLCNVDVMLLDNRIWFRERFRISPRRADP